MSNIFLKRQDDIKVLGKLPPAWLTVYFAYSNYRDNPTIPLNYENELQKFIATLREASRKAEEGTTDNVESARSYHAYLLQLGRQIKNGGNYLDVEMQSSKFAFVQHIKNLIEQRCVLTRPRNATAFRKDEVRIVEYLLIGQVVGAEIWSLFNRTLEGFRKMKYYRNCPNATFMLVIQTVLCLSLESSD